MKKLAGKTLKSYEIHEMIGAGNFAAVYRASQAVVQREVAIKVIWPVFASQPEFIRHFEREAQFVAGLEHPYIVPLYDYWRDPKGAYIVMRWIRGGRLSDALQDGAWPLPKTISLVEQITGALMLAHRSGIIHRDVKPDNILLDEAGNAYLTDFGIAQIANLTGELGVFSSMGSPAYAAPEQFNGTAVTPATDQYSLAVILYEMLAGEHPFPELANFSHTELLEFRLSAQLPSLHTAKPDIPAAVNGVLQRATALNPANRYPDIFSMAQAFRQAVELPSNGNGTGYTQVKPLSPAALSTIPNPYRGLRPFQEVDNNYFFGRGTLIGQLLTRLGEDHHYARFLALVGPSGSGKSSVVNAGLIPVLRHGAIPGADKWFFETMIPGMDPFAELATALTSISAAPVDNLRQTLTSGPNGLLRALASVLPDDQSELLLFIDQFEEIFTLTDDDMLRAQFLEVLQTALTDPASRLRLVITLRADFYDRPLLYPTLGDMLRERTEVIVPLNAEELERAIVEPARRVGVQVEDGVIAAIQAELQEQPGTLPLLQYSLSELFQRRIGSRMTTAVYKELGGVRGALARRAEEIYHGFSPVQREATRQIFLRLITLGEGTEDTRRRTPLAEINALLHDDDTLHAVIETLDRARLVTFDRDPVTRTPTVEVTHEALIREWQRLRVWLDESRNDVRMQLGLASFSAEWMQLGRDPGYLLKGARLSQYDKWASQTTLTLTEHEREYLNVAITERTRQEEAEIERQAREKALERRSLRSLQMLAVVLLAAIAVALGLTAFALMQWQRAETSRINSEANAALSQSLALSASARQAMNDDDGDLAVVLALEAVQVDNVPPMAQRVLSEVALAPGTRHILTDQTTGVMDVALNHAGTQLATVSTDLTLRLWDAQTGELQQTLTGHTGDVHTVAFTPDDTQVVTGSANDGVIVWDVTTGEEVRRMDGHGLSPIWSVAISPDGRFVASGSSDGVVIAWELASGQEVHRLVGHQTRVNQVMFTPDSQYLLSAERSGILWDLSTGQEVHRLESDQPLRDLALSADGHLAVGGFRDGRLIGWHVMTRQRLFTFNGEGSEITSVVWHPEEQFFYAGTVNGSIQVWDTDSGEMVNTLRGHTAAINALYASQDGTQLVSSSVDDTVRVWNIGTPDHIASYPVHEQRITGTALSADGQSVYTASIDGSLRKVDIVSGRELLRLDFETPIMALAVSADEQRVLLGLRDARTLLVDMTTGEVIYTLYGHIGMIRSVAFSPDEQSALTAAQDGFVILWDLVNRVPKHRFEGHSGTVYRAVFNAEGTQVLSASQDGTLRLWDVESGELLHEMTGHDGAVYSVAISPDGRYAVSGGRDSFVLCWDLSTGTTVDHLVGHEEAVWTVDFTPDGQHVISGGADAQLIFWELESGSELQRFSLVNTPFAIDTDLAKPAVVTGQEDGILQAWRVFTLGELIEWTQTNRYLRPLSCVEMELFHIGGAECSDVNPIMR